MQFLSFYFHTKQENKVNKFRYYYFYFSLADRPNHSWPYQFQLPFRFASSNHSPWLLERQPPQLLPGPRFLLLSDGQLPKRSVTDMSKWVHQCELAIFYTSFQVQRLHLIIKTMLRATLTIQKSDNF